MYKHHLTGREPRLIVKRGKRSFLTLSLRRLGAMLNIVDAERVSLDALAVMISNENVWVRYSAAKLLAERGDRESRLLMAEAIENGAPRTRASVARHLYNLSWYSAEPLVQQALQDPDERVRESVIYSLCGMGSLNAYQVMVNALDGETDLVLEAAAYGLRDTYDSASVPVLQKVLTATNPEIRIKALEALGISGAPEAIPIARQSLFDPDYEVLYAAVLTVLELGGVQELDHLVNIIIHTTANTLATMLRAFFHATNYLKLDLVNADAFDAILQMLVMSVQHPDTQVRQAAIWPLAWIRHDRAASILQDSYHAETDPTTQAHIVRVAVSLMALGSEILLEDAAQSDDVLVRAVAEEIYSERERTGITLTYDDDAYAGRAMDRPLRLGRLDKH